MRYFTRIFVEHEGIDEEDARQKLLDFFNCPGVLNENGMHLGYVVFEIDDTEETEEVDGYEDDQQLQLG